MNRIAHFNFSSGGTSRLMNLAILCLSFALVLSCSANPQPLYQNLQVSQYFSPPTLLNPPNSPPQIDATAFDNESTFTLNFNTPTIGINLYETSDTLFYTNGDNGLMIANCPVATNYVVGNLASSVTAGAGFYFDEKTNSVRKMAGTFYNSGTIRCDSVIDGNVLYGECLVLASNIYNPGKVVMGIDSLLQYTGNTVSLNRSDLELESLQSILSVLNGNAVLYNNLTISSYGDVGNDTNGDWNPAGPAFYNGILYPLTLSATNAISSYPDILALSNSASYFKIDPDATGTNFIVRAVFVQNNSSTAPYNVYIQPQGSILAGNGTAYVGWTGYYTDPASGLTLTNYLYLQDDYLLGASTNVAILPGPGTTGYPDNFNFYTSPTPLLTGPLSPSFPNGIFANQSITNRYAFMNGQIVATTIATNASISNPSGSITNLSGRIQINASQELDLNNAKITGQNYLSIQATNQFDGSAGSFISSPYSDINLGVTNGNLAVTNLLVSDIPNWSGTVQAWSTRWTNSFSGVNVDYRVLLVYSQLQPTTEPWVQNLKLHTGTNLVISDVLNVFGSLYLDAQNLTVTTNGYGIGATSSQGELNGLFAGNLGPNQWPNLLNVTNNGVISGNNLLIFTNKIPYGSFINNGLVSDQGTIINAANFVNGGSITNGLGNLSVQCQTATLTNSSIYAGGNLSIIGKSLLTSNVYWKSLSLTLNPSNYLSDCGVSNSSTWVVGRTNGTGGSGFALLSNPANGDFLGTTVSNICPPSNKLVANTWAGRDFGPVSRGFSNNAAIGRLILDVQGNNSLITFNGIGTNCALYVDSLEFREYATNGINNSFEFTNYVALNTNITIYFAQAFVNGISIAEKIDNASLNNGKNGGRLSPNGTVLAAGRLRWVPSYAGYFSSTNVVSNGVTNVVNAALASSQDIDSNGNGLPNAFDPAPFFNSTQINFSLTVTNLPTPRALLSWATVPFATNYVYYTSNLLANSWQVYTNFNSINVSGPAYPVIVSDTNLSKGIRFYKVVVLPWLTYPY